MRAKSLTLKAVAVHFNRLISVCPLEASPNQIVLVGRSPTLRGSFSMQYYLIVNLSHEGKIYFQTSIHAVIIHYDAKG